MAFVRSLALTGAVALTGCSIPPNGAPSLAPRAAETIDPRAPVRADIAPQPADPKLAARLSQIIVQARSGEDAFSAAVADAQRLAAAAGPTQSESWVVAQQAVSVAVAARAPTTRALGDIDAIAATTLAAQGSLASADLIAIEAAAAEVETIDQRQAQIIDALQQRLGN